MINIWHYSVVSFVALLFMAQASLAIDITDTQLQVASLYTEIEPSSDNNQIRDGITAEQEQSLQYYERLIEELESSGGVYVSQLSEVFSSLGNTYQMLGRHADAIAVFQRSLHITRVNDGLYSLNQVAMIEKMIESNSKLKDWDALNKNYHNLYWISKRHYGENNPEMLALIDRIGRWHLQAYELEPSSASFSHLLNAEQLYNKSVEIIELHSGKYDLRLINALYGIALTNYQIAAQVSNVENFDDIRAGFRNSNQCRRKCQS